MRHAAQPTQREVERESKIPEELPAVGDGGGVLVVEADPGAWVVVAAPGGVKMRHSCVVAFQ